jgi:hypothetical protein
MFAKLLLALLVVAAAHASTLSTLDGKHSLSYSVDCNNGLFCATGQTCMSTAPGAGAKLACSPYPNAVICNDKRFSCPAGKTCLDRDCTQTGRQSIRASKSENAQYVASSTYGDGVDILPTDAPGLKGIIGKKICKSLIPILPSFCSCSSDSGISDGSNVACQVNVGDRFNSFINVRFKPCDSNPTITYSWGDGILGTDAASDDQEFTDDHDRQIPIPGTSLDWLGYKVNAQADVSGKFSVNKIIADVRLDVCSEAVVNNNGNRFRGCAGESSDMTEKFSAYLDVPGARPPFLVAWQYMPPRCAF